MTAVASFGGRLFGGRLQELLTINRNTLLDLDRDGFTKVNKDATIKNKTMDRETDTGRTIPIGVLGSSVAVIKGSFLAGPPSSGQCAAGNLKRAEKPLGLFINDAAGRPFESVSALGSGKAVFLDGSGTVGAVQFYETNVRDVTCVHTAALLTYTAGDRLFADMISGLLTNVLPVDGAAASFDAAAFDITTVKNAVYPEVIGEVLDPPVDFGFMIVKWLK